MNTPALALLLPLLLSLLLPAQLSLAQRADAMRPQAGAPAIQVAAAQPQAADAGEEQLRQFVEQAANPGERAAVPGARIEVRVGKPGAALSLAPCERMEPFIPTGARLWGRTTLGVRCVQGATWQAMLPVEVRVFGPAPVAVRALSAGDTLSAADVSLEEVELSRFPLGAIADPERIVSKVLLRPVAPGQPLQAGWFRARPVIAQGDTVKVVYAGKGFSVSAEGRALQPGLEGSRVRVQLESGRNVTGIARDGRIVELSF